MDALIRLKQDTGSQGGWIKYENNPILGVEGDFVFDNNVIRTEFGYRMYYSWRNHYSIAFVESNDGINWGEPQIAIGPRDTGWEEDVNRPAVVVRDGVYHMWYSGQTAGRDFASETWTEAYLEASRNTLGTSDIGYAWSDDGVEWNRRDAPVLKAAGGWEEQSLMCPAVIFDEEAGLYKMWFAGGGWFEPDALGYATSKDGITWNRVQEEPVFTPDPATLWERARVAGPHVEFYDGWYYLFYIGYEDMFKARIGLARSRDGVTDWERHPQNPILSAGIPGGWDSESIYKPFLLPDPENDQWLMWFNARQGTTERIGLATHPGMDLGFDSK